MTVRFNPEIFREYDVRGIAESDLTDDVVISLGAAFAGFARKHGAAAVTIGWIMVERFSNRFDFRFCQLEYA